MADFWEFWSEHHSAAVALGTVFVFWLGSGAYVFRYTKRTLERRGAKQIARLESNNPNSENGWTYNREGGDFESTWEFSSPSLFFFLIGGPILAPILAYLYHLWTETNRLARLRYWFFNWPNHCKAFVYKKTHDPASAIQFECNLEYYENTESLRITPQFSNHGRFPIAIDGLKATLWKSGVSNPVSSWHRPWKTMLMTNAKAVNKSLGLSEALPSHQRPLRELVCSKGKSGIHIYPNGHEAPYKFTSLPSNFDLCIEFLNAKWV